MMKRIFLLVFFLLFIFQNTFSQTAFSIGIDAGTHFNKLKNENDMLGQASLQSIHFKQLFPNYKAQHVWGYHSGIDIQFGSPGKLSFATGIGWTRVNHQYGAYHFDSTYTTTNGLGIGNTHLDYADLPLFLSLTLPLDYYDTRRVNFRIGPQVSYLFNYGYTAEYRIDKESSIYLNERMFNGAFHQIYYDSAHLQFSGIDSFDVNPYATIHVSLRAEFNAQYDISDFSFVSIGAYMQYGFTDPENKAANLKFGNLKLSYWNVVAGDNRVFPATTGTGNRKKTTLLIYGLWVGFHQKF